MNTGMSRITNYSANSYTLYTHNYAIRFQSDCDSDLFMRYSNEIMSLFTY